MEVIVEPVIVHDGRDLAALHVDIKNCADVPKADGVRIEEEAPSFPDRGRNVQGGDGRWRDVVVEGRAPPGGHVSGDLVRTSCALRERAAASNRCLEPLPRTAATRSRSD